MPSKNKIRGYSLEKEVELKLKHLGAKRAWGSNGCALGMEPDVDVFVKELDMKIQCKRRKATPSWLGLMDHLDATVFREDRGEHYIIMKLDKFIGYL